MTYLITIEVLLLPNYLYIWDDLPHHHRSPFVTKLFIYLGIIQLVSIQKQKNKKTLNL